jgi:hypothetical protein
MRVRSLILGQRMGVDSGTFMEAGGTARVQPPPTVKDEVEDEVPVGPWTLRLDARLEAGR